MGKGLLIVLSGPSGAGKDTVLKEVLKKNENLKLSISATTRLPRQGEENGKDYFFVSKEEFKKLINDGKILEYAEYCDNFYGTPRENVETWLNQGYDVVLELETNGGEMVKKLASDSVGIFIVPPSFDELARRLNNRNTDSESSIKKRLAVANNEVQHAINYDYIVVNDLVSDCAESISAIIKAEKLKSKRNPIIKGVMFDA